MSLGERLIEARKMNKLTQKEAAKKLGINNSVLSRYESGERSPDPETIAKIAITYSVSADWLLNLSDDPTPPKKKHKQISYEDMVLSAPALPDALRIAVEVQAEYDLSEEWLHDIWVQAIQKFGVPEQVKYSEPAAHGPNTPGTGILDKDDRNKE